MDIKTLTAGELISLKAKEIAGLLAKIGPHMELHPSLAKAPCWAFQAQGGRYSSVVLSSSKTPPIFALSEKGLLYNAYGSAAWLSWDVISLDDLVQLNEKVGASIALVGLSKLATKAQRCGMN